MENQLMSVKLVVLLKYYSTPAAFPSELGVTHIKYAIQSFLPSFAFSLCGIHSPPPLLSYTCPSFTHPLSFSPPFYLTHTLAFSIHLFHSFLLPPFTPLAAALCSAITSIHLLSFLLSAPPPCNEPKAASRLKRIIWKESIYVVKA